MRRLFTILPALLAAMILVMAPVMTAHAGILPGSDKLTIRKENEMGRNFDKIIRSQMSMVGDTYITDYVDELVQNVVKGKRPMPYRIQSAVIANPLLNAFAIPGGFIYIFTGLVQEVTTEAQLVGVIAHELAHVSQRHVASRIEKQGKVSMLTMAGMMAGLLVGVAGGSGTGKAAKALIVGSQSLGTAAMLQYSQDDEREADHVGLNSMVKAGYNPEGMPDTFEIMRKNRWFDSGNQNMPSYLSTHPGLSERITYLHDRIKRMPEVFTTRKDDNTMLRKVQALIRSKMSSATTALAYYENKNPKDFEAMDYVALGNVQQRLKDTDKAKVSFEKALKIGNNDPLVNREAGIFFYKTGEHNKAFKYLQKSIIKNKRDALAIFYLARLQAESKQYDWAEANMRKVMELVPEDWEVHHHLGIILGESGNTFQGNLHLAYSALYSGNTRKARYHAEMAGTEVETDAQKEELKKLNEAIQGRSK